MALTAIADTQGTAYDNPSLFTFDIILSIPAKALVDNIVAIPKITIFLFIDITTPI